MITGGPKQFAPLAYPIQRFPGPIATPGAAFEATPLRSVRNLGWGSQWPIGSRVLLSRAGIQYYGKYVDIC
jgi:hypothetical protein